jgi:CheY-like chemotaxis protein
MQVNKNPSVMIADDSEDTRELLRFWLEAKRCRVVEATNGQEAVDLTRGECPDLILMDMLMPVLDGMDAARRIREHVSECDVHIVAMSSHPSEEAWASARDAGCSSFIAHPIDFDQLGALLSRLLPASARPPSRGMVALMNPSAFAYSNRRLGS